MDIYKMVEYSNSEYKCLRHIWVKHNELMVTKEHFENKSQTFVWHDILKRVMDEWHIGTRLIIIVTQSNKVLDEDHKQEGWSKWLLQM